MEMIYLDNAATTRVDDAVALAVNEVFLESYGNASSLHDVGQEAKRHLEGSREKIAAYFGCEPKEITFTSGGTESNNLAIRGLAKANPEKKHIVTSVIEHPCVLDTCKDLESEGYEVDYLKVDEQGIVSLDEVREKVRDDTLVVSVMHVNNEIGTLQPVEEIGIICRKKGVYFHTDNVQGFLKEDLALASIDLMSISGHKVQAPKGVGILYIRNGVKIKPILTGGGQENNLRSGTENVPGAVGLAAAIDVDFKIDEVRYSRDKIIEGLMKISGTRINGSLTHRVYNNINVSFYGIEGEALMLMLNEMGIFVSTGSACASTKLKESYVLKALDVDEMYIHGSIRLSLGVDVIGKEDYIVGKVSEAVEKLREMSPFKLPLEELGVGGSELGEGKIKGVAREVEDE
ncbi:cysteine desulfurase [archaeon]|nr:cysteine desulfurase [archaeon]MBT7128574.1 cysteine desulfurase [archaeon]